MWDKLQHTSPLANTSDSGMVIKQVAYCIRNLTPPKYMIVCAHGHKIPSEIFCRLVIIVVPRVLASKIAMFSSLTPTYLLGNKAMCCPCHSLRRSQIEWLSYKCVVPSRCFLNDRQPKELHNSLHSLVLQAVRRE